MSTKPRVNLSRRQAQIAKWLTLSLAIYMILWLPTVQAKTSGLPPAALYSRSTSDSKPIKIGFVTSLTGVASIAGQEMVDGIRLYLDQVHNRVAGRAVELIIEDDQSDPAVAAMQVRKLVEQDHCQILDGLVLGHLGYAVAPVVDKLQVPMIFAVAGSNDITQRQQHPWIIRTGRTASQALHPFGEWVYKTLGYKKVVCLALDYPYGWECVGGFQKSFEEAGGEVVQKIWAPLGFRKFGHFVEQIDKDADAVFVVAVHVPAHAVLEAYRESGLKLPLIAAGGGYDDGTLSKMGDDAVGIISAGSYSWTIPTEANQRFVKAFRKRYNKNPTYYSAAAYISGLWTGKALEDLKGDVSDKHKVLAALKRANLTESPVGPLKLDEHGNSVQATYVLKVQKVNGQLRNMPVHTFENVGQFWHWDPETYLAQPAYSKDYPPCVHCAK